MSPGQCPAGSRKIPGSRDWTSIPIPGLLKIQSRDFSGFWYSTEDNVYKDFYTFSDSLWVFFVQCVQSSLSQNGGADLRSPFGGKFLKALKSLVPSPQLFPEIFGFAQRSFWWAAGSEQPSPPLRPVVTDLLNGNQLLHQYLS